MHWRAVRLTSSDMHLTYAAASGWARSCGDAAVSALISPQKYLEAELGAGTVGLLAQIKSLVGASRSLWPDADRLDPARIVGLARCPRADCHR